jgi:bifunctional non-homologous end joining protein LigD
LNVPLELRKQLLFELVQGEGYLRALGHIVERGDALWALCEEQRTEGMVVKRKDSRYTLGPESSDDWIKLKRKTEEDFVVVGFSQGDRGEFKALLVAQFEKDHLRYLGRVGTGYKNSDRISLVSALSKIAQPKPAAEIPTNIRATFVEPQLVVKVRHQGWSNAGHLRAASFQGIHESKNPTDCVWEGADLGGPEEGEERLIQLGHSSADSAQTVESDPLENTRAQLSNLEKVYFPDEGFTKGDLVRYYAQIAPFMLPHLRGRPVVLVRYPDGIKGKNFYQWRAPDKTPAWIRTFELYDDEKQEAKGGNKSAFLIDSVDALIHIANLGCIPLHVLAGREQSPEYCDFLTIDS